MTEHLRNEWEGFLSPRAIVMGRHPTLEGISKDLANCTRCQLCQSRQTVVSGEGNPQASLVFIGNAPGEEEDQQGRPFTDAAGQLLDRMIQAIGLKRQDVYMTTIVKCKPPGNRIPEFEERNTCFPFLDRQLQIIRPKIVIALGEFAAQTLLQTEAKITELRGVIHPYPLRPEIRVMPTYHPAYLLKNPAAKKESWADLQAVAIELGLQIPTRPQTLPSPS